MKHYEIMVVTLLIDGGVIILKYLIEIHYDNCIVVIYVLMPQWHSI